MPELDPLVGDMSLTQTRWSAARPKPGLQISLNTKLRVIHRRAYGFHTPEAMIALGMLALGGLCPDLPGRPQPVTAAA